jgi:hypothetical protein
VCSDDVREQTAEESLHLYLALRQKTCTLRTAGQFLR